MSHQQKSCRLCADEGRVPGLAPWREGLCPAHWYQEAWVGRVDTTACEPAPIPAVPAIGFDAMVSIGLAHPADTPEFERDLQAWLRGAA
jgi:hypothetical protein